MSGRQQLRSLGLRAAVVAAAWRLAENYPDASPKSRDATLVTLLADTFPSPASLWTLARVQALAVELDPRELVVRRELAGDDRRRARRAVRRWAAVRRRRGATSTDPLFCDTSGRRPITERAAHYAIQRAGWRVGIPALTLQDLAR